MRTITVGRVLQADVETVWEALADIAAHVEWMADARSIRFTSAQTEGTGTTFVCDTRVGPLRLNDRMEVTEWVDEQVMAVRHVGLVTGEGRFTLTPRLGSTELTWTESLTFPWWIPSWPASLVLREVWRWNLRRFERTLGPSGPSSGRRGATGPRAARRRVPRRRRGG